MNIKETKGVIFDIDDTLLDNRRPAPVMGMHEQARFQAFHKLGREKNIPELANVTYEQNSDAFLTAPVHSLPGAVWNLLWMVGLVDSEILNPDSQLLQEVVKEKNIVYLELLKNEGKEVDGAGSFVRSLAEAGLVNKMAVASSAIKRDIKIFLDKFGLKEFFPEERILSLEDIVHTKPHPEIFDKAFKTLGLKESDRSKVLAFEDDPRGITSAKAAGLYVCGITTRFTKEELLNNAISPDMVADSYAEFAELLGLA